MLVLVMESELLMLILVMESELLMLILVMESELLMLILAMESELLMLFLVMESELLMLILRAASLAGSAVTDTSDPVTNAPQKDIQISSKAHQKLQEKTS